MGKLAVCEGEVVTVDGKRSSIDFYTEEFVLSDKVSSVSQARSMLQAGLVAERLRSKISGFRRVRTCQVISLTDTDRKASSSKLDELLLAATELGCVPEQLERYASDESKARALQVAIERFKERSKKDDDQEIKTKKGKSAKVTGGDFIE